MEERERREIQREIEREREMESTTTVTHQNKNPAETSLMWWRSAPLRVTSEFDSESSLCLNKISTKLMDNLVKFKLSFRNDSRGQVNDPHLTFTSKHLSLDYDVEERNALVKAKFQLSPSLHLTATRDIKVQTIYIIHFIPLFDNIL